VQAKYIINFLLQIQDVVNFDKTVEMMINYKIHNMLLEELFEQTDQAMKRASKENSGEEGP
jgi:hypothetical protein